MSAPLTMTTIDPRDVLILMPCSGSKRAEPCQAFEICTGPLWQTLRLYAGAIGRDQVCVLSGKLGFFNCAWLEVEPYEAKLTRQRADYLIERGIDWRFDDFGARTKGMTGIHPRVAARRPGPAWRAVIMAGAGDYARVFDSFLERFIAEGIVERGAPIYRVKGGIGCQRQQLGQWLKAFNSTAAAAA